MAEKKKSRPHPNTNTRGAAMIVVLCVMAVLLALSLTMLFAASSVVGTAKKSAAFDRCRILAESFSDLLEKDTVGEKWLVESSWPEKDREALRYFAMRSLRSRLEDGTSAGIPFYDNTTMNTTGVSLEEQQKAEKEAEKSAAEYELMISDSDVLNVNGYTMQVKVYLEGNAAYLEKQRKAQEDGHSSDWEYYRALAYHGNVRLVTLVTAEKGETSYRLKTTYRPQVLLKSEGAGSAPQITWQWEVEGRET